MCTMNLLSQHNFIILENLSSLVQLMAAVFVSVLVISTGKLSYKASCPILPQLFRQLLKTQKRGEPVTSHFNSDFVNIQYLMNEKYHAVRFTGVQLIAFQ